MGYNKEQLEKDNKYLNDMKRGYSNELARLRKALENIQNKGGCYCEDMFKLKDKLEEYRKTLKLYADEEISDKGRKARETLEALKGEED